MLDPKKVQALRVEAGFKHVTEFYRWCIRNDFDISEGTIRLYETGADSFGPSVLVLSRALSKALGRRVRIDDMLPEFEEAVGSR